MNACCEWKTQKVLPLTYDDSLSYYEQLCKLINTINDIVSVIDGNIDVNIQEYIDKRFNNLMINATYDSNTETIFLKKGTLN